MITLPTCPMPARVDPTLLDYGIVQRPATGAAITRIDRPGNRYKLDVTMPPMEPDTARIFNVRLQQARSIGLRLPYPLLGVSQGLAATPVVNGSSAAGTSLPIRGIRPGYVGQEGYWLTVIDAAGNRYLHEMSAVAIASAAGLVTLSISPALRAPLPDGTAVLIEEPTVDGLVTSTHGWSLTPDKLISFAFTMEEMA